jgi:hypothetical protein
MSTSSAAKPKLQAKIGAGMSSGLPTVEVVVPHGTAFAQVAAMHETISRQAIAKISPRGCQQCSSGVPISIREKLENVILVDLPVGR